MAPTASLWNGPEARPRGCTGSDNPTLRLAGLSRVTVSLDSLDSVVGQLQSVEVEIFGLTEIGDEAAVKAQPRRLDGEP